MKKSVADYLRVAIAYYNQAQTDKTKQLNFEEVKINIADIKSEDCVIDMAQDIHAMTNELTKENGK